MILKVEKRNENTSNSLTSITGSAKSIFIKQEYKLPVLNDYLSDKSYLDSTVSPTDLDRETFDIVVKIHKIQSNSQNAQGIFPTLPHFFRWFRHISSFTAEERLKFPKTNEHLGVNSRESQDSIAELNHRVRTQSQIFCFCCINVILSCLNIDD